MERETGLEPATCSLAGPLCLWLRRVRREARTLDSATLGTGRWKRAHSPPGHWSRRRSSLSGWRTTRWSPPKPVDINGAWRGRGMRCGCGHSGSCSATACSGFPGRTCKLAFRCHSCRVR